jgi:glycosyltransferase involved in cell wall biosynthesis
MVTMKYVLITPARNEEALIGQAIESMIQQTVQPVRWVIVDDGSTDKTADIVATYCLRYRWIELVRRPARKDRNFAGKVDAFNAGMARVDGLEFDAIGNLDGDITFGADHFEFLLGKLSGDPELGVVGTAYTEVGWDSTRDSFEGEKSVHGACQLFRRECFVDIGGYVANAGGGIDWIAVTTARMRGWKTRNFAERRFRHHRKMGTAQRSPVGAMFDYGKKDYFLGNSPLWEFCRVVFRAGKKPILIGGGALLAGYCWSALRRIERPVSRELVRFHRSEQRARLKEVAKSLLHLQRVENYYSPLDNRHLDRSGRER